VTPAPGQSASQPSRRPASRRAPSSASLRAIGLPRALAVRQGPDGQPLAVARTDAHGRRGVETPVESIEEQWRLAEAWWREASQARTYYRVMLEGGRPLTLFHDDTGSTGGGWFEQPYSAAEPGGAR